MSRNPTIAFLLELISSKRALVEKHLKRYERDPVTGCWNWTGPLGTGSRNAPHMRYGSVCFKYLGRPVKLRAHRLSYAYYNDEDPGELFVLHRCDNPRCINPDHLVTGTAQENTADMMEKNRQGFGLRSP